MILRSGPAPSRSFRILAAPASIQQPVYQPVYQHVAGVAGAVNSLPITHLYPGKARPRSAGGPLPPGGVAHRKAPARPVVRVDVGTMQELLTIENTRAAAEGGGPARVGKRSPGIRSGY